MSNKENIDEKNDDKKEIEDEEREKMLNSENIQKKNMPGPEVVKPAILEIEDGREVKPKKIPIGGIKMPGFFTRSRSKEKCKEDDDEGDGNQTEASKTVVPESTEESKSVLRKGLKLPIVFSKKSNSENNTDEEKDKQAEAENRRSLLDAIRLPLVSVFPRLRKTHGPAGNLADSSTVAGLASAETLGDFDKIDDGMENIKLDAEKTEDPEKQELAANEGLIEKFRRYRVIIGALSLFVIIVIIILIISLSGAQYVPASAPVEDGKFVTAVTSCGNVQGILEDGAFAFRGIPYAVPPLKEKRWTYAAPLDNISYCWNGTRLAHKATPACWQIHANGSSSGIEDCLTLDVITPYVRYHSPIPVIVMIGAESFTGDSPSKLRPSARYARSRDVIFVRPNFRVGVMGFLAADVLSKSTYPQRSGNYGLSDIIKALKWVQLNIEHFGGDKKSVTLFGHRTGATLVTALATSIQCKGLFSKVWATSGSALFPGKPLSEYVNINKEYLEMIQCSDMECLRSKDVPSLLEAVPDTWRRMQHDLPLKSENISSKHEWLVLDGDILRKHPIDVWRDDMLPVQLILGTTAHSSASNKLFLKHTEWTPELVRIHTQETFLGFKGISDEALRLYNDTYKGLAAMISDIRTVCPLMAMASQLENATFYVSTMTRGDSGQQIADVDSDVAAILGRYEPKTPEQRRYVAAIQQLFYHFVWHGTIHQDTSPTPKVLIVDQDTLPAKDYPNCDFWIRNEIVPNYASID